MPIHVRCPNPQCGKPLVIPDALRGKRAKCPSCGAGFSVAEGRPPAGGRAAQGEARRCPSCQSELPTHAVVCVHCGLNLKTGGRAQVSVGPGGEAPGPGSAAVSQLRDFMASGGKWLLLGAVSLAAIGYLLLRPGPAEPPQAQKPPETQKASETAKPPQETPKKPQPPQTPESKKPPPPPPSDEDFALSPPLIKALVRWDKLDHPMLEQYVERLRSVLRGSFRLVEEDKANWKLEVTQPEQPTCPPGYVLAYVKAQVRLGRLQDPPGGVTALVELPTQSLFIPWYYVFPYAQGARVLWQKLTSACFEFSSQGGKVSFGGQELEIPPGAVPEGTRVTLHYPYEDPKSPSGAKSLLHCIKVDVEPAAVVFSKPATLRLVSARLPGAARAFQAHVARRGAKLTEPKGIAAILPGGPVIWAPANQPDKVYGWDPSNGIVTVRSWDKPEQGWVRVPFDMSAFAAASELKGREQDVRRFVGPTARVVPSVVRESSDGEVDDRMPALWKDDLSPELKQALEGVLESKLPVAVRVRIEDGAGQVESRAVELAAAIMHSDVRGDLLHVWEKELGSTGSILGADRRPRHRATTHGPPHVEAMLGCKSATDRYGLVIDLTAYMHRMPLECLLYRLGDVPVAVGISVTLPKPGVCSVMVDGSPPEEPKAME